MLGVRLIQVIIMQKIYHPGQDNYCCIFSVIGLAYVVFNLKHISEKLFLIVAESLSKLQNKNFTKAFWNFGLMRQISTS